MRVKKINILISIILPILFIFNSILGTSVLALLLIRIFSNSQVKTNKIITNVLVAIYVLGVVCLFYYLPDFFITEFIDLINAIISVCLIFKLNDIYLLNMIYEKGTLRENIKSAGYFTIANWDDLLLKTIKLESIR